MASNRRVLSEIERLAALRGAQLHRLWLICNVLQRTTWMQTLSHEDAAMLHAYQATLSREELEAQCE